MTATNVQVGDKTYPLERVVDAMLRLREDGEAPFFDREAWNKGVRNELDKPMDVEGIMKTGSSSDTTISG